MFSAFRDREEAGQALVEALGNQVSSDAVVLGLPRGGVPVAAEIAKALNLPLDVLNVRKLGVPWHPELAMGAIAEDGTRVLHEELIRKLGIAPEDIEQVADKEQATLSRRAEQFRGGRPETELAGHEVILVDDGLATGATMEAAISAVRARKPTRVVVAIPVGPAGTTQHFSRWADRCICLEEPRNFRAVGLWYESFGQVSDEEVCELLGSRTPPVH